MENKNIFQEYQEQCDNCSNPPGTRCESNPSECPYKVKEENITEEDIFDDY